PWNRTKCEIRRLTRENENILDSNTSELEGLYKPKKIRSSGMVSLLLKLACSYLTKSFLSLPGHFSTKNVENIIGQSLLESENYTMISKVTFFMPIGSRTSRLVYAIRLMANGLQFGHLQGSQHSNIGHILLQAAAV